MKEKQKKKKTNLKPKNKLQKIKHVSIPCRRNRKINGQFRQVWEIL